MSARLPKKPNSLNGADITPPTTFPSILKDLLRNFLSGFTINLFNDSPNGLITLSLNVFIILSFILSHPRLNKFFTPSIVSVTIRFIGSNALKNGSAILSYKKSDIFIFHSFIVIFIESTISISNQVLNLSISPPERFPSHPFSPKNHFWNLSVLAAIPPANPNNAPPIGPPGKKNDGSKPNAPATAPVPPKNVANLKSTP